MNKKLVLKYLLLILFLASLTIIYINTNKQKEEVSQIEVQDETETYNSSNIMKDVSYTSKDINGNDMLLKQQRVKSIFLIAVLFFLLKLEH